MKNLKILVSILLFASSAFSYENDQEEDFINYESIVKELSPSSRAKASYDSYDPLSQVRFHVGVAFANSLTSIQSPQSESLSPSLKGVSARLGIDLLSQFWRAEGGITTYEPAKDEAGNRYELKEFDLNLVYHSYINSVWSYKWGAGFSARYLDLQKASDIKATEYSTPAIGTQVGIFTNIGNRFSIGSEISYRKSIGSDTPDRSAVDLSLRVDGHF